ncbi:DUF937 domain-containing protein [Deinococcus ficus]|uniref:DUF937 domain-containing protein n=1 Tax=Deinococcus ficus TaxID=317577 RepID=UPI0003B59EF3|nr:DUF937 domain-containing protein [Deinococcus ficus]
MMDIFNMLGGMNRTGQMIGQQLGTSPHQTEAAVEAAVPLLLGALTRNAAQPGGAAALEGALSRHDGQALELFGQGRMPDTADGQKILGHIFGPQQSAAANAVGQRAGIDPQMAMQVLSMLAPLVLAYLSRQRQGGSGGNVGAGAGGMDIGSILGGILGGGMGGGLGDVLGGRTGSAGTGGAGGVLGGGPVIPGLPGQNAGLNPSPSAPGMESAGAPGSRGGLMDTLNNVLDRNGNGNALDDLIGMFGGRR